MNWQKASVNRNSILKMTGHIGRHVDSKCENACEVPLISKAKTQHPWMCKYLYSRRNLPVTSERLARISTRKIRDCSWTWEQLKHIFSVFERKGGKKKCVVKRGSDDNWCLRPKKFYKLGEFLTWKCVTSCGVAVRA